MASAARPVLVIEGHALRHVLAEAHRSAVFDAIALRCATVIACRCTPAQKAALVGVARHGGGGGGSAGGRVVLAIGDGGNDVAMIQAANVGVGLSGREGQQAARAADFALSRFAHLVRLLLVHGRLAHYRTALVAQYTFYKSQLVCFLQLAFNVACAASGCSLLDTFSLTGYNLIFTALPGTLLVLDVDRRAPELLSDPTLYAESQVDEWVTASTFLRWSARALIQAVILLCIGLTGSAVGSSCGASVDQSTASYVIYTAAVVLQLVTLTTEMRHPGALNHASCAASLLLYVGLVQLRNSWPVSSSSLGTLTEILRNPSLYATTFLAIVASASPWLATRFLSYVRPIHECVSSPSLSSPERHRRGTAASVAASTASADAASGDRTCPLTPPMLSGRRLLRGWLTGGVGISATAPLSHTGDEAPGTSSKDPRAKKMSNSAGSSSGSKNV